MIKLIVIGLVIFLFVTMFGCTERVSSPYNINELNSLQSSHIKPLCPNVDSWSPTPTGDKWYSQDREVIIECKRTNFGLTIDCKVIKYGNDCKELIKELE